MSGYHRIEGKRGLNLARKLFPPTYQEVERLADIPVEIVLGEHPALRWEMKPTVYWWMQTDGEHYFAGFAFYHVMDYTDCLPGKVTGGQHRHDLEGAMVRVPYVLPHRKIRGPFDVVTVYHKEFKRCYNNFGLQPLFIAAKSHAISIFPAPPMGEMRLKPAFKPFPSSMGVSNMIEAEFNANGVNMPWQWSDNGKLAGAFWDDPRRLFE